MTRSIVTTFLAAGLIAVGAQLTVPLPGSPVPVTLQTLAVVWVGALLRPGWALGAGLLYLAAGSAGLPVFAGGGSGWQRLVGPTAGFLWSFPLASGAVSLLRRHLAKLLPGLAVFLGAHALILVLGGLGLLATGRTPEAVTEILAPLLPGAAIKSLAAWLLRPPGVRAPRSRDPDAKT